MIKPLFCFLVLSLTAFHSLCQDKSSVGIFAGIPNNDNYFLYDSYAGSDSTVSDYSTLGLPGSLGVHYYVESNERWNYGLEVNYTLSGYKYNYVDTVFTTSGMYMETYNLSFKKSQLRILLRANYYFVQRDKFKLYGGVGAGYRHIFRTTTSNQPGFVETTVKNTIPFTGRIAVGFKYYPLENIGLFGDVGVFGGSLVQIGVCLRQ